MRLPATSRVYATWTFTGTPPPVDVLISLTADGDSYYTAERPNPTSIRLLVAGPSATGPHPPGTVVLPVGRNHITGRAIDTPELVVFDAGTIDVA